MDQITIFNPEHDMALANGDRHFIAPRNIREMSRDLTPLMDVIDDEEILVWGWDYAVKVQLLRMGVTETMLPTDASLIALRKYSERQSAHHLLHAFHAAHPDGPYAGESILAHCIDDIPIYAARHGHIILKDPLSSSGKGLRHVNFNENNDVNENTDEKGASVATTGGLSSQRSTACCNESHCLDGKSTSSSTFKKVENWANALIRRHGYLTAEPYYDKVQDFAMEFCIRDRQCHFIGYSLFTTNRHGRYESNLLMTTSEIENELTQYIPHSTLHEVRNWIISHHDHIIPKEWDTTKFPLYFGIDMMVVKNGRQFTIDNSQLTIKDSEIRNRESEIVLHPCVEINLRLNMGIIAHEVHRKLLAPNTKGTFHITSFTSGEEAEQFYKEHTELHPATYNEGRIVSGYHPLTPIHPYTRHHAYIICRPSSILP